MLERWHDAKALLEHFSPRALSEGVAQIGEAPEDVDRIFDQTHADEYPSLARIGRTYDVDTPRMLLYLHLKDYCNMEGVTEYTSEQLYSVDAESFIAFYESNGWKVGKNPMKSWRAALVTWQKRNANASTAPQFNPQTPNFNGTYQTRMDRERAENAERKRQLAEMAANACAKADAINAARFGNP